jgi:hypothetical protein
VSHVASIDLDVKDLNALKKACADLGLEFMEGQTTHKWYGKWVNDYNADDAAYKQGVATEDYGKCVHALKVKDTPGAYEVGVIKNPNGKGFKLIWDFYAGGQGLMSVIGTDGKKLIGAYAEHATKRAMKKQGLQVKMKTLKDGTRRITGTAPIKLGQKK